MKNITNEELILELKSRLKAGEDTSNEQADLMQQLQIVNKKLKDTEAVKSNFLSNIRNEIVNPFTSILGLSKSILQINNGNWDKVRTMISLIHSEAFDLDFQFKNIFTAAAIEAGDLFPDYARVNVKMMIQEVIDSFANRSEQKQISVQMVEDKNIEAEGFVTDPEKFQLIISNLLSNAIKYSRAGGVVEIHTAMQDQSLQVTVKDKGIGFDQSDENFIFNRFTQIDSGMTKSYAGHGLGLSIVKALTDNLNGEITVKSKKNQGSIFTLIIPEGTSEEGEGKFSDFGNEIFFSDGEKF